MKEGTIKLLSVVVVLLFYVLGFYAGCRTSVRRSRTIEVHDTTYITRTLTESLPEHQSETLTEWRPVPVAKPDPDSVFIELHSIDTLLVPQFIHDTLYVPITQKYYERLDGRLRVWVSGYQPQLDKWELDERTAIVRKKLGFSVGLGTGVIYTPFHSTPVDAGVGVFAGLTYNF